MVQQPDDLLAEVEDRAANPPRIWDPEGRLTDRDDIVTEPAVAGVVEDIDIRESGYGPYKVTVLRGRDGSRVSVAWWGAVLESRGKNVEIGDAVAVRYLGKTQPRDQSLAPYANFDVVHARPVERPRAVAEVPAEAEEPA
jgi:hypothetical protein